jgi:hypothetical protein
MASIAPWVWQFAVHGRAIAADVYGGWAMPDGIVDAMPTALLSYRSTPVILGAAALAVALAIARRRIALGALAAWCGLLVVLANPRWLGIRSAWLMLNTPVAISYWLPTSVFCGWLGVEAAHAAAALLHRWQRRSTSDAWLVGVSAGALLLLCGWGGWRQIDVVNPATVLVSRADVRAMRWAEGHLQADALVLVNSQPWMGAVRMGSDGGWWLPIIGHRQTTLPSVLYVQGPADYRSDIQDLAGTVEQAPTLADSGFWDGMRSRGITHVFVGARAGRLSAGEMDGNPCCDVLYAEDSVRVYALR